MASVSSTETTTIDGRSTPRSKHHHHHHRPPLDGDIRLLPHKRTRHEHFNVVPSVLPPSRSRDHYPPVAAKRGGSTQPSLAMPANEDLTVMVQGLVPGHLGPLAKVSCDRVIRLADEKLKPKPPFALPSQALELAQEGNLAATLASESSRKRVPWEPMEVHVLKHEVDRLEQWTVKARRLLGEGAASSSSRQMGIREAQELLTEGRSLDRGIGSLHKEVTDVQKMVTKAEAFAMKVRAAKPAPNDNLMSLPTLRDLVVEGLALRVVPEPEMRYLLQQQELVRLLAEKLREATQANCLESCQIVLYEDEGMDVDLGPKIDRLRDHVTISEWASRAQTKLHGRRSQLPLSTVEHLLADDNATDKLDPQHCLELRTLLEARTAGRAWQDRATGFLKADTALQHGREPDEKDLAARGTLDELTLLLEEHSDLPRVCVPHAAQQLEALIRKGRQWLRKVQRLLILERNSEVCPTASDGQLVVEEAMESDVTKAIDFTQQIEELTKAVASCQEWTQDALAALDRVKAVQRLGSESPPTPKRRRKDAPSTPSEEEEDGDLAILGELTGLVEKFNDEVKPRADELPGLEELEALMERVKSLSLRDITLERDVQTVIDKTRKWQSKVRDAVREAQFPRPIAILKRLVSLLSKFLSGGIAGAHPEEHLKVLVGAAREEVWANRVRNIVTEGAGMPVSMQEVEALYADLPPALKAMVSTREELAVLNDSSALPEATLAAIRQATEYLASALPSWFFGWPNRRPSHPTEVTQSGAIKEGIGGEWDVIAIMQAILSGAKHVTAVASTRPLAYWTEVEAVLFECSQVLVSLDGPLESARAIEATNEELEKATGDLLGRMKLDHDGECNGDASLFGDLLDLLRRVDECPCATVSFEKTIRPLVSRLTEWQGRAKDLFHWDDNESPLPDAEKPQCVEVDAYITDIKADEDLMSLVSIGFLEQVGFISGVLKAAQDLQDWESDLDKMLHLPVGDLSLAALRKHVARRTHLAVEFSWSEATQRATFEADQWLALLQSRRSRRKHLMLKTAEEILRATLPPEEGDDSGFTREIINKSEECVALNKHVGAAKEHLRRAMEAIKASHQARTVAESADSSEAMDHSEILSQLATEGKALYVQTGIDKWLASELRARNDNSRLREAFKKDNCTLEEARHICQSVHAPPTSTAATKQQTPMSLDDSPPDGDGSNPLLSELEGMDFSCDGDLLKRLSKEVTEAEAYQDRINQVLKACDYQEQIGNGDVDPDIDHVIDKALEGYSKQERLPPAGHHKPPDYAFPLPFYTALLPSTLSSKAAAVTRKSKKSPEPAAVVEDLPLSLRILDMAPWNAPPVSHTRAPIEEAIRQQRRALSEMAAEQRESEKVNFRTRLKRAKSTMSEALAVLAYSSRVRLKMEETQELRWLIGETMSRVRSVLDKHCVLVPNPTATRSNPLVSAAHEYESWELDLAKISKSDGTDGGAEQEKEPTRNTTIDDLLAVLLEVDGLPLSVRLKSRVVTAIEAAFDWRVRAQCLVHNLKPEKARPRPWVGDRRTLEYWSGHGQRCLDIFESPEFPPGTPVLPHAADNVVIAPPVEDYIQSTLQMRVFYLVECCRHFMTVYTDMCEICNVPTTLHTDTESWITCDKCDKWYHQKCAHVSPECTSFVCPVCRGDHKADDDPYRSPSSSIRQTYDESLRPPLNTLVLDERDVIGRTINQRQRLPLTGGMY
ncbi:hypothetical protein FOL47_008911 [Perkinsus chesapeaki]|uniref:PHD-type domain-containing protein n=1 Tax=Perkinsus chesapeaki TaxID=330153 RepID=A0A7J6LB87_PERCH|nr:hypothetical protein FOL47_008911 [Perkinsus chesapeaki]